MLRPSDFGLPNNPARPVLLALTNAFVENFNSLSALVSEASALVPQPGNSAQEAMVVRMMTDALRFVQNIGELSNWIFPPTMPLGFKEALRKAEALKRLGCDEDWFAEMVSTLQKRHVGRPPDNLRFIRAFEFMLQSKANSQGQATRKFCACRKETHTAKCEQALKAGNRKLKRVLRRYAPQLVSRYDVLHPDRSKKVNG